MNFRIKEICKERGMLLKDLATKLGITEVGLSKSLNGDPGVKRLQEIANVLDVPLVELFEKQPQKGGNEFICPHCGARLEVSINDFPKRPDHANIRGKEYYK